MQPSSTSTYYYCLFIPKRNHKNGMKTISIVAIICIHLFRINGLYLTERISETPTFYLHY